MHVYGLHDVPSVKRRTKKKLKSNVFRFIIFLLTFPSHELVFLYVNRYTITRYMYNYNVPLSYIMHIRVYYFMSISVRCN